MGKYLYHRFCTGNPAYFAKFIFFVLANEVINNLTRRATKLVYINNEYKQIKPIIGLQVQVLPRLLKWQRITIAICNSIQVLL